MTSFLLFFLWLPDTYLFKDLAPELYLSSVDKCPGAFVTEMGNLVSKINEYMSTSSVFMIVLSNPLLSVYKYSVLHIYVLLMLSVCTGNNQSILCIFFPCRPNFFVLLFSEICLRRPRLFLLGKYRGICNCLWRYY